MKSKKFSIKNNIKLFLKSHYLKFLEQLSIIFYPKYIFFLQKELVKSLEDVGSGLIGWGPFDLKREEEKKKISRETTRRKTKTERML